MEYIIEKNISCDESELCSDIFINKLEKKFMCCLKSVSDADSPHGSISIYHGFPHIIRVVFYEYVTKLNPMNKGGIQKLNNIPSKSEVESIF